jgi:hypothetical protein
MEDRMSKRDKRRLAIIEWRDAATAGHGWMDAEEVLAFAKDTDNLAVTCGLWLGEHNGYHMVTLTAMNDGQFMPPLKIPSAWVKRIRLLPLF